MSRIQIVAVLLAIALNALDGMDVLAITFAAPVIARDWGVGPAALGVTISAGLAGMTIGSLLLAPLGDRSGRRPLVLLCVAIMGCGMLMTATATSIAMLCLWRVVTGIGIGGMLAAINAVAAEFASDRRRELAIAAMAVGYPVGGLIGGFASAELISTGWQAIFVSGGVATLLFLPVAWFGLPESIVFLARRRNPGDDQRIAVLLARMGHPPPTARAEEARNTAPRARMRDLLGPRYHRLTLLLVTGYSLHMLTFYFFSGWLPKLMSDAGYATPDAIRTSAIMSIGGVCGGIAFGWAAPRFGLLRLLGIAMGGTSLTFALFANVTGLSMLQASAFLAGVCVFGGVVGIYALLARSFPPELRVTGTGLAIGIGRGSSIIGPLAGGALLQAGVSLGISVTVVELCSLAAWLALLGMPDGRSSSSL